MPTQTFYHLPTEKKMHIEEILLNVFYNQHISDVKITQIIEQSTISRAAFYKYFPTLQDAHHYMIKKIAFQLHSDIQMSIEKVEGQFFLGIENFLRYCGDLSHDDPYWKGIKLLIKGENTDIYTRSETSSYLNDWIALLSKNNFNIQGQDEARSFLYFTMTLVIDALTSYSVNEWSSEELVYDFQFKVKWLKKGLL